MGELYSYYRRSADMLANVLRDAAIVPALAKINAQKWWPYVDTVLDALVDKDDTAQRRAALRLVIDFWTWKKLGDCWPRRLRRSSARLQNGCGGVGHRSPEARRRARTLLFSPLVYFLCRTTRAKGRLSSPFTLSMAQDQVSVSLS